jgi:hypothetical protein
MPPTIFSGISTYQISTSESPVATVASCYTRTHPESIEHFLVNIILNTLHMMDLIMFFDFIQVLIINRRHSNKNNYFSKHNPFTII